MNARYYPYALAGAIAFFITASATILVLRAPVSGSRHDEAIERYTDELMEEGRQAFRYDTFGDEAFWSDALKLHLAVAGEGGGGVGPGLSPEAALSLGLKVDVTKLPPGVVTALEQGEVDLRDPNVTLTLLQEDAVVGLRGSFSGGELTAIGVTCALCHSTVDDSFAPGIGEPLDGWANRDLDVGAIIAIAPDLTAIADLLRVDEETVRTVARSWGPGKFDASLLMDGKAFRPDGGAAATLIPPAFGLAGVNLHTWTGWGSVTHWNAFVGNLEMGGQGTFYDPRLNDAERFPVAARSGFGNVRNDPDLVTPKLAALHLYQLAIPAPRPPAGSYDPSLASEGEALFNGRAQCSTCHVPPLFTEPGYNMHTPEEIGIDAFQAERSPDGRYRTAPLKGLWTHTKGGFYHDGRFETLNDVVDHYDQHFGLGLSEQDEEALVQFMLSLGDAEVGQGTAVEPPPGAPVSGFALDQNYPNPFADGTTISFDVERPVDVTLDVYGITGRRIVRLMQGHRGEGRHTAVWNGKDAAGQPVPSGVYFCRMRAGGTTQVLKMTVVR